MIDANIEVVIEFLLESTIPGIRKALQQDNPDVILTAVVKKADLDTMTGGRFNGDYSAHHEDYRKVLLGLIHKNKDNISSTVLIDAMKSKVHGGVTVGLIQKLVNMTLKYIYIISKLGYQDRIGIVIDVSSIDFPLDSSILKRLSHDNIGKKYTAWTKIKSLKEYTDIQEDIRKQGLDTGINKLYYDFEYWGYQ